MARAGRPKVDRTLVNAGDRRRHDLLEAAYTLIGEKGMEALRTRDIAASAGVNISTLHYYFGTKEALLVALVEHASLKFKSSGTVQTCLRDHFESALQTFATTPHLSVVLQALALRSQRDLVTRAALAELHNDWSAQVARLLQEEIRLKRLRPDLDIHASARVVTSFILGAMMQLEVNPTAFDFRVLAAHLEHLLGRATVAS